ncbi:MAG TPA: acyl carrier protein [Bryobacteraceae bacterium]|nr:acyl carrier protein [Bryobacteraceae bacterium]
MVNEERFRTAVAEILSVDPAELTPDTRLESLESYDSVAALSLMVCLSDFTSQEFSFAHIRDVSTYGDLLKLAAA